MRSRLLGSHQLQVAHQLHRGRHEHEPHERGVEEDRHRQADADLLDLRDAGQGEDREHDDHDQRGAGDHLGRALETLGDRAAVVAGRVVALLDPAQQEDLVVHREAEDDRQQQRWRDRVDVAERGRSRSSRTSRTGRTSPARRRRRRPSAGSSARPSAAGSPTAARPAARGSCRSGRRRRSSTGRRRSGAVKSRVWALAPPTSTCGQLVEAGGLAALVAQARRRAAASPRSPGPGRARP